MGRPVKIFDDELCFDDIHKFGVNLKYVEYKLAVIEQRINERLAEYIKSNEKMMCIHGDFHTVYVRDMKYCKIGGNQKLLCCVVYDGYSIFLDIAYTPTENNKTGAVGLKFNKCVQLDVLRDRVQIKDRHENLNELVRC